MRKKKKEQKYIMIEELDEETLMKILQKQSETINALCEEHQDLCDVAKENSIKIFDMHNIIFDMTERIEFLECHVNVLETDQFDLYVDRVVN